MPAEPDVVEELDHWIRGSVQTDPVLMLKRARDEIVALRNAGVVRYSDGAKVLYGVTASRVRAEALEEVAQMIDEQPWRTDAQTGHLTINGELVTRSFMAAAIRALKERQA
jgi:hypothetical protein